MSHNQFWQQSMEHLLLNGELEQFSTGAIATFNSLAVRADFLTGIVSTSLAMLSDLTGFTREHMESFLKELETKKVITRLTHSTFSEYSLHPRLFELSADIEVLH